MRPELGEREGADGEEREGKGEGFLMEWGWPGVPKEGTR